MIKMKSLLYLGWLVTVKITTTAVEKNASTNTKKFNNKNKFKYIFTHKR